MEEQGSRNACVPGTEENWGDSDTDGQPGLPFMNLFPFNICGRLRTLNNLACLWSQNVSITMLKTGIKFAG